MNTPKQNPAQQSVDGTYTITLKVQGLYLLDFCSDEPATFYLIDADQADNGERPHKRKLGFKDCLEKFNCCLEGDAKLQVRDPGQENDPNQKIEPVMHGSSESLFTNLVHFQTGLFDNHPDGRKVISLKKDKIKGSLSLDRGKFFTSILFKKNEKDTEPTEIKFVTKGKRQFVKKQWVAEEITVEMTFSQGQQVELVSTAPGCNSFPIPAGSELILSNLCTYISNCSSDFERLYDAIEVKETNELIIPDPDGPKAQAEVLNLNTSLCGGGCTC